MTSITLTSNNFGSNDAVAYGLFAHKSCDTDGDGIPNHLDLDSDGDGCPDAIEGTEDSQLPTLQTPHCRVVIQEATITELPDR
ncbi:hypothetical protein EJ377_01650 [Chryseobacterium arthrosphaerae]|uniref:Thrombospondin n=1 Tax=Chryseobacterium arthrosphaerae TaxID=651561 RepID=A0A432DYU9_9FLAO|nr:hypothetical protein EJ377_01650 [Chryseobacterium arthrosphaerae]